MDHPVQAFFEQCTPNQQTILNYVDMALHQYDGISAKIRHRIPFYYGVTWICYCNPIKNDGVELCFIRGNELQNEAGILIAKGRKLIRGIEIYNVDDIPHDALQQCFDEAIHLDQNVPYHPNTKLTLKSQILN